VELAGVFEISKDLGVARSTVSMWDVRRAEGNEFPEPVATLECGRIYDLDAIRVWYAGRPKRKKPST